MSDLSDVSWDLLSVGEFFEDLVREEKAGVLVVDDGFVSEVGFSVEEKLGFVSDAVGRMGGGEVFGDFLGGNEAIAHGVEEDVDDDTITWFGVGSLF